LCTLFISLYSFQTLSFKTSSKKNWTDEEMWDLYYEYQEIGKIRHAVWNDVGLGYFSMWLAVSLYAVAPGLICTRFFRSHWEVGGFQKVVTGRIRFNPVEA
jgi:hypothetical protein